MKTRYRLIRRGIRGGTFYCVDTHTGKRTSLRKANEDAATQIVAAKNQAQRQPMLNLQIAKAYLAGSDNGITTRTWQQAITALTQTKHGANQERWRRVVTDAALARLWPRVIIETPGELLLSVLHSGTVSTNVYLRRLHNFCVDMNWLPWPLIPKRQWPAVLHKDKRALTWEEHQKILAGEGNLELRAYYELLWHLGASQTDLAMLTAADVDGETCTISYARKKTGSYASLHFGETVAQILRTRPKKGFLFPMLSRWNESDRASVFSRRCKLVGISGISLHSYRYAWAERAKTAGYPERFAQVALGHNSKAVHRAYARKAQVTPPSLEEYEQKIVPFNKVTAASRTPDEQPLPARTLSA